jgi:hypothetical protein
MGYAGCQCPADVMTRLGRVIHGTSIRIMRQRAVDGRLRGHDGLRPGREIEHPSQLRRPPDPFRTS